DFLIRRLPDVCLLLYILAATLGAFTGGIWASFGIGGALILFLGTWAIEKRIPWPERQLGLFALVALEIAALAGAMGLSAELLAGGPLLKMMRGPAAGLFQYNRGLSYLVLLAFPVMA